MGSSESKDVQPEELLLFKRADSVNEIQIPEPAENRVPTDRKYLIVFGVMILVLLPFLIYTLTYADTDRYHGYDNCGNICGKNNTKYDKWECTGKDYTNKRFMQVYDYTGHRDWDTDTEYLPALRRECVVSCPEDYREILMLCMKQQEGSSNEEIQIQYKKWSADLGMYVNRMGWRITLACFFALAVALAMLYLFRTATAAMVYSILVAVLALLVIAVGYFWYWYSQLGKLDSNGVILFLCIFFTILLVILVAVVGFLQKKIALVIALFKETMKATCAMPMLLLIPVLTFFAQLILLVLLGTLLYYMLSAGVLTEMKEGYFEYARNIVMEFTFIFNAWMFFWAAQFVTGLQYMVIAGAVSRWYFASNKNDLGSPILTSAYVAFKFHLGSLAFGSMIITIITFVRNLLSSIFKNKILRACLESCCSVIENFLKYLSKNAYILTAMHGKPFYKSGKRAAQIILRNVVNIVALNYIGDFILFMAHILVVLISMLFVYITFPESEHNWAVYLIVAFVALIVAGISFSIFETVIDTIFLCFCEDKLLNDGMARPYAMSRDLMEFMESSRRVFGDKK